ncbi:hypothetical protein CVT24_010754 [Panaeolus cyanescens]|uniref:F-box domain-containing protein n=1 Tax=Panaeolus cyanescens TaxID=181874 RepID=A0A409YME0_9AGAR|nr:hypothetical protein CVT24_010754 [Panaeolus cyanescens]
MEGTAVQRRGHAQGKIILHAGSDDAKPTYITPDTITIVYNVRPIGGPLSGLYHSEDAGANGGDGVTYSLADCAPTMIITHSSYIILKGASPILHPHIIYELKFGREDERCGKGVIDHGPLEYTRLYSSSRAMWPGLCATNDLAEIRKIWKDILDGSNKTDDMILADAWKGRGNMWILVRPDRFPIRETMAAVSTKPHIPEISPDNSSPQTFDLPADIFLVLSSFLRPRDTQALMSTCKLIYYKIHNHVHRIVHTYIKVHEPWFLPVGPFNIPKGDEEVQWWYEQWEKYDIKGDNMDLKIPWLQYRRACSHSMSMWNRIRIWRNVKKLETIAEELGLNVTQQTLGTLLNDQDQ